MGGFLTPLVAPAATRLILDEGEHSSLEHAVDLPQWGVVQPQDVVPDPGLVQPHLPVQPQLGPEQLPKRIHHPCRQMHAVGHVADRDPINLSIGPERVPHGAGHSAVSLGHSVHPTGEPYGHRRHVVRIAALLRVPAEGHERVALHAQCFPNRSGAFLHLVGREDIVARRDRRMRSEHTRSANAPDRLLQLDPGGAKLAKPLDEHEAGVPLVGVPHGRFDAEGSHQAHPGDAEDPLLADSQARTGRVQHVGEPAIRRVVSLEVRIQQVHRDAADLHSLCPDADRATAGLNDRDERCAVGAGDGLQGRGGERKRLAGVLLPAIEPHPLIEVALGIEQPDGDHGYAEVGGRFQVIAGEHAQPAGVDRHRVVQAELGAEVGHRPSGSGTVRAGEPRVVPGVETSEGGIDRVVPCEPFPIGDGGVQSPDVNALQQGDRIMPREVPERLVERSKQRARIEAPAPPQVRGDRCQASDPLRERLRPRG